jgi:hypothetical protein
MDTIAAQKVSLSLSLSMYLYRYLYLTFFPFFSRLFFVIFITSFFFQERGAREVGDWEMRWTGSGGLVRWWRELFPIWE